MQRHVVIKTEDGGWAVIAGENIFQHFSRKDAFAGKTYHLALIDLHSGVSGGPAEAVSPRLSARIGAGRAGQLAATGEQLVTMCPICLSNLEKAGANVLDLSAILARGLPRREPDQAAGPGQ